MNETIVIKPVCPACKEENNEGATRCKHCGEYLLRDSRLCPFCASVIDANAKKCINCGENLERRPLFLSVVWIAVGIIGIVVTLISVASIFGNTGSLGSAFSSSSASDTTQEQQAQIDAMMGELESIRRDLKRLEAQSNATISPTQVITNVQVLNTEMLYTIATLNADVDIVDEHIDDVENRLKAMEKTVLDNPGKALEVTILKTNLENMQGNIEAMRQEVSRAINFFQFGLGTIALAMVGLAISNFWLGSKSKAVPGRKSLDAGEAQPHADKGKSKVKE